MPEKITPKNMGEKDVGPDGPPITLAIPKPKPAELELDEADTLFQKRTDL
jgi:hypothetical protein